MPHMGSVSRNNNRDKTKDNSLFVCRPRCWVVWTDKPENEFSFISSEPADLITRRRWWLGHSFPIPRRSSWTASLLHVPSILARFYTTHVRSHRFHSRSRQCASGFACRPHCFVSFVLNSLFVVLTSRTTVGHQESYSVHRIHRLSLLVDLWDPLLSFEIGIDPKITLSIHDRLSSTIDSSCPKLSIDHALWS